MTVSQPLRTPGPVRPDDAREMLDRQVEVLELIADAAPLPTVLTRILRSLEGLIPGARCSVLLLDRERGTLHHGAAPSLPGDYVRAIDGLPIGERAGSCGSAAALHTAVVASDVRTDPRWEDFRGLAAAAGLRSCWSTPIDGRDGLTVGTFAVYHDSPHRPSPREVHLVERCTHLASVAIEHAGLLGDLVASEERFRRSFDANSLGMAILGPDRVVVTGNTALADLCGGLEAVVGHPLAAVLTPCSGTLEERLAALDHDGAAPTVFEGVLHRRPAQDVEVEVTLSPLHAPDGGRRQYVVNVLDLTERRAAERHRRALLEAETARRTAEEASHAKSELLAAVGHEARTPIQAIVGFAELLGTMDLDPARRREALAHIDAAAGHVMDLLSDVLDLSRLEAGALPLEPERVPLAEAVQEVFDLLSATAARREVELCGPPVDHPLHADRRRLRQVLLNLVGNAVRYVHDGGHISVCSAPTEHSGVLVTVTDDGPGIPPELLPRLFTPFTRADPVTAGSGGAGQESIGLGLGLAHGLAAAMGGALRVGDTSPAGTTMELRLPDVR